MGSVSVVGTWRLVSSEGRSSAGDVSRPYGDAPVGLLLYGADGYMSATLMRPGRPHVRERRPASAGTPEEVRLASEGFLAYCGTYEVDAAARHHRAPRDGSGFPKQRGHGPGPALRDGERPRSCSRPSPSCRAGKTWVFRLDVGAGGARRRPSLRTERVERGSGAAATAAPGGFPDRSLALPTLEADRRRPRGDPRHGRPRGRRAPARLRAEAQLLRPRRRHRARRRRSSGSGSSTPRWAP